MLNREARPTEKMAFLAEKTPGLPKETEDSSSSVLLKEALIFWKSSRQAVHCTRAPAEGDDRG